MPRALRYPERFRVANRALRNRAVTCSDRGSECDKLRAHTELLQLLGYSSGRLAVSRSDLHVLPDWEPGTVAVLSVGAGHPHAIPVSTAVRIGPRTVVFALALRRESLARLRQDPRCALTVMTGGNIAVTAHGRATIVEEPMVVSDRVAAVRIDVEAIQDHGQDHFEIDDGVCWRWTDPAAEHRDREIRAALSRLAQ